MTAIRNGRGVRPWAVIAAIFCAVQACPRAAHGQTVRPQIVNTFPHDVEAFTQGLLLHDGKFYESTGLVGRSTLRRVVPATGAVEWRFTLAGSLFGEGLALAGNRLIQLTWQNNVAMIYDLDFNRAGTFDYDGEGWGLCSDGTKLVMSDGTSRLFFRDPQTFALRGEIRVVRGGSAVERLNELECVGGLVYANVWQTDTIVRVDSASGEVLTTIDASGLLTSAEAAAADVLNGIAFDSTTGHFFLTGKLWPKVFEVRFDFDGGTPQQDGGADAARDGGSGGTPADGSVLPADANAIGGAGGVSGIAGAGGTVPTAGGSTGGNAASAPANPATDSSAGCACRLHAAPRGLHLPPWTALFTALCWSIRASHARSSDRRRSLREAKRD